MEDPDYADKYSEPYGEDKIVRMAKQSVDARFVEGKTGLLLGGALQDDPVALGGELGLFHYLRSWLCGTVSFEGLATEGTGTIFTGLSGSLQAHVPSRLAPFAGTGVFLGYSKQAENADRDFVDNDNDLRIDEPGERRAGAIVALYPEVGAHFWLTPRLRLSGSARYMISTIAGEDAFWFYGIQLGALGN